MNSRAKKCRVTVNVHCTLNEIKTLLWTEGRKNKEATIFSLFGDLTLTFDPSTSHEQPWYQVSVMQTQVFSSYLPETNWQYDRHLKNNIPAYSSNKSVIIVIYQQVWVLIIPWKFGENHMINVGGAQSGLTYTIVIISDVPISGSQRHRLEKSW